MINCYYCVNYDSDTGKWDLYGNIVVFDCDSFEFDNGQEEIIPVSALETKKRIQE